jgi:hypothetical protein
MMVAVALLAVLIPFPYGTILAVSISVLLFWLPTLFFTSWIDERVVRKPGRIAAIAVPGSVGTGIWLLGMGAWLPGPQYSWNENAAGAVASALTVANGAGPIYAARRFRRGETLTGGHLLWAWSGLVWSLEICLSHPHRRGTALQSMVEISRLTLVLAVLLALYGTRPVEKNATWTHYAGWVSVECDMIFWGWYAAQYLG